MINYKEMPQELQDYAENLAECLEIDFPNFLENIDGWYEDSYNGAVYIAFIDNLTGLTHCHDKATGYRDQVDGFVAWVNNNSKELEVEVDFISKEWSGTPDKYTVTFLRHSNVSPWQAYAGNIVGKGEKIVSVNGKKKGYKVKNKIITLDR